ncbi:hypothetical protein BOX15_Mlig004614g4 [Macrostomum lignano]|uniref:Uncharacterized protein n=1 Tax=Macrostomum lignano TaxID=282301 RepID=A0A267DCH6_9PLAT|nr:hypothetical protein BOX15_Mlig004614g4 [Macrostomum lignano]
MKSLRNSKSFIIICMTAIQTLNKSVCLADEICYENFLGQANLSYLCPTYCCGEATTYPTPFSTAATSALTAIIAMRNSSPAIRTLSRTTAQ